MTDPRYPLGPMPQPHPDTARPDLSGPRDPPAFRRHQLMIQAAQRFLRAMKRGAAAALLMAGGLAALAWARRRS